MTTPTPESRITTDHEIIKQWVAERNGVPTILKGTESNGSGLLRIDFPGYSGEDVLEEITWEQFFQAFEDNRLAFLYQEKTAAGTESRLHKFISRDTNA